MKAVLAYLCGNDSWGGLELNQLRNALWMKERGHHVFILCLANSPMEKNAKELMIPFLNIQKHRKYYDFKKGRLLTKLIIDNKITHLVVRATHDMSIAAIAKNKLGAKLHLSYFMEMQLGVKKTNFLHTRRFRYFDLWSCPLNWLAGQVETMTKFPKERIKVIPSGLDLSSFENSSTKDECRNALGLPTNQLVFGLIGRFDKHKGQLLLLKAMVKCPNNNFCVAFLGEPTRNEGDDYFQQMQSFIEEHNLNSRVVILPFRKDIEVFYKAIDWFVMASRAETFGMVTIEAMACGTPTLGSRAGGTPELLKGGNLGVLFETQNPTDLAIKMQEIVDGMHSILPETLKAEANRFDKNLVCSQVEKALKLQ